MNKFLKLCALSTMILMGFHSVAAETVLTTEKKEEIDNLLEHTVFPKYPKSKLKKINTTLQNFDTSKYKESPVKLAIVQYLVYSFNELYKEKYESTKKTPITVSANNGKFIGNIEDGVASFKGIPYAKPPVDNLRWKAPVYPENSTEIKNAIEYGDACPQYEWFSELASYHTKSEDCLSLNIWTSDVTTKEKKPVMVWIHGGAWGWGGSSDPIYDGHNFVKDHNDVVLISINYRLGIFGFMDVTGVPGGEEYTDSSNLGILDQIMALKWIYENIDQFGGDPENITVFGESVGGVSVSLLLTIKEAQQYINRGIMQSGALSIWSDVKTKAEKRVMTDMLMEATGAKNLDDLKALSADEIMALDEENWITDEVRGIIPDGKIIPLEPRKERINGISKDIDIMVGASADEYNYWIGELEGMEGFTEYINDKFDEYYEKVSDEDKEKIDAFIALKDEADIWRKSNFFSQTEFILPAILEAEEHSAANGKGKTFMYYWTHPSKIENYGACHAVDLAYVLNNKDETIFIGEKADDKLSAQVQEAWINFAKTGNPSPSHIDWPEYDPESKATMIIDTEWKVEKDILKKEKELLIPVLKYIMH